MHFQSGQSAPATAVWCGQGFDVAAIAIRMPIDVTPVPVTEPPVQPNTPVFAIGFGQWYASSGPRMSNNVPSRPTVKHGVCLGNNLGAGEYGFSFRPVSGDSGGGVFRVDNGELLAVTTISISDPQTPGGATGRPIIRDFLAKHVQQTFPNWDRRRPPGQQPSPQQPYPQPSPTVPADLWAKLADGQRRLEELERKILEQGKLNLDLNRYREDLESLRREFREQRDGDANRKQGWELQRADLTNRLELLSTSISKLGNRVNELDAIANQVRPLIPIVVERSNQVEKMTEHASTAIAVVERLSGYASWLPWIAGGAATGGSVPLVMGGMALYRLFRRKLAAGVRDSAGREGDTGHGGGSPGMANVAEIIRQYVAMQNAKSGDGAATTGPGDKPPVVVQPPWIESNYVPVEKPNGELGALLQAMDLAAQKYPGTVGTVQLIQDLAKQIHGGKPKGSNSNG